ncbi:MAG: hypothetical protein VXZ72_04730 [Chlamydiota bacterium]|nr:hypothetical protein [Chlamydiota bacterium]
MIQKTLYFILIIVNCCSLKAWADNSSQDQRINRLENQIAQCPGQSKDTPSIQEQIKTLQSQIKDCPGQSQPYRPWWDVDMKIEGNYLFWQKRTMNDLSDEMPFSSGCQFKVTASQGLNRWERSMQWTYLNTNQPTKATRSLYNLLDARRSYLLACSDETILTPTIGLKAAWYNQTNRTNQEQVWSIGATTGITLTKNLPYHFYFTQSGATSLLYREYNSSESNKNIHQANGITPFFEISAILGWSCNCWRNRLLDFHIGWEANYWMHALKEKDLNFNGLKVGSSCSY